MNEYLCFTITSLESLVIINNALSEVNYFYIKKTETFVDENQVIIRLDFDDEYLEHFEDLLFILFDLPCRTIKDVSGFFVYPFRETKLSCKFDLKTYYKILFDYKVITRINIKVY